MLENYLRVIKPPNQECFSCHRFFNTQANEEVFAHTNNNSPDDLTCHAHKTCIANWSNLQTWRKTSFQCGKCWNDIDKENTFVDRQYVEIKQKEIRESNYLGIAAFAVLGAAVALTYYLTEG